MTENTSVSSAIQGLSEATMARIRAFRDDRNWRPFHNPKDLALSVSIEAAELLEVFQWSGGDLECEEKRAALAEELADVVIYAAMLADRTGLSLDEIVSAKLAKNEARYPVERVKEGGAEAYDACKAEARAKKA